MRFTLLVTIAVCAAFASFVNGAVTEVPDAEPPQGLSEDCRQPKEMGRCFGLFHRFAFNLDSRECEEFIFGGCAGNKNNFETKEACEAKCKAQPQTTQPSIISQDNVTEKSSSTNPRKE